MRKRKKAAQGQRFDKAVSNKMFQVLKPHTATADWTLVEKVVNDGVASRCPVSRPGVTFDRSWRPRASSRTGFPPARTGTAATARCPWHARPRRRQRRLALTRVGRSRTGRQPIHDPDVATLEREQVRAKLAVRLPRLGPACARHRGAIRLRGPFGGRAAGEDGRPRLPQRLPSSGLAARRRRRAHRARVLRQGRLRCPYHGWTYDDRGALAHVPHESSYPGLDRAALSSSRSRRTWLRPRCSSRSSARAHGRARCSSRCAPNSAATGSKGATRRPSRACTRCQADWKLLCEHRSTLPSRDRATGAQAARCTGAIVIPVCGDDVLRLRRRIEAGESSTWSARAYGAGCPTGSRPVRPTRALHVISSGRTSDRRASRPGRDLERVAGAAGQSLLRSVSYAMPDASREMRLARYLHHRIARRAAADDRAHDGTRPGGPRHGRLPPGPIAAS